jgi:hypothetical protein
MFDNEVITKSESSDWQVPATFGRREMRQDPAWEREFADSLRAAKSGKELTNLFARFRSGERALMR